MRPHVVPRDNAIPVSSDACANGTRANHAAGAITRYAPRTVVSSWLVSARPAMAMKTMTAPIHATEDVMCVAYVNLRRAGLIIIAADLLSTVRLPTTGDLTPF